MTVLIIDGHNFIHRARTGFGKGEFNVVFNFFRNLRYFVGLMKPTRVIFPLEGHPQHRYDLLPEYKGNRIVVEGTPAHEELADFHRQKDLIVDLMMRHFPVSIMRHPRFECDDVVFNIINNAATSTQFVVASNDSDFIQLLQHFDNVRLYNPMQKKYIDEGPPYDYVSWKALVGDGSDNIDGFKSIGGKRAKALLDDNQLLERFFREDPTRATKFLRNRKLIKFARWSESDAMEATSSNPTRNWDVVRTTFYRWGFNSIANDKSWAKYVSTFDPLWGEEEAVQRSEDG